MADFKIPSIKRGDLEAIGVDDIIMKEKSQNEKKKLVIEFELA